MATCTHVGNPLGAVVCAQCGATLGKRCPHCQESLPHHAHFCLACGLALPKSPVEPPSASLAQLESSGERRSATILFSDLTGYTAMNERLDPEEVEGIMRRIKERAV